MRESTRKKWSTIKDVLHTLLCATVSTSGEEEDLARFPISSPIRSRKSDLRLTSVSKASNQIPLEPTNCPSSIRFLNLNWFRITDVKQMFDAMTGKSSPRDFISTTLLKDCSGMFTSVIAWLANLSFVKGLFPIQFKTAQVIPIVKKADLDTSSLAS